MGLNELSATALRDLLQTGQVSAREVLADHVAAIQDWNPIVNALVTPTIELAQVQATLADSAHAAGRSLGVLHGIPIAHKDLADTKGIRTTYGSPIFRDNVPQSDCLLVERLRAAGSVCLGKTNTPEFGTGSHTYNRVFGTTTNPYAVDRSAGGSSGGAAAALAAGMTALADGSDLGGSLRNPASFCNVVGLRPSAGLVPSWPTEQGWAAMAVEGPMARCVEDVALMLGVLAGYDERSPIAWPGKPTFPLVAPDLTGTRIGWCPEPRGVPIDQDVLAVLAGPGRAALLDAGAELIDVEPDWTGAEESFRTLRAAGYAAGLGDLYRSHPSALGEDVRWNIEQGLDLTAADIAEAEHLRTSLYHQIRHEFDHVDVLALPTAQVAPFPAHLTWPREVAGIPMLTYLDWMRAAYWVSPTGLPAISVPFGFTSDGLPVGVQLVGRPAGDAALLQVAFSVQETTNAHHRRPQLPAAQRR